MGLSLLPTDIDYLHIAYSSVFSADQSCDIEDLPTRVISLPYSPLIGLFITFFAHPTFEVLRGSTLQQYQIRGRYVGQISYRSHTPQP